MNSNIRVIHQSDSAKSVAAGEDVFVVDRTSPLGNPYVMDREGNARAVVIRKYKRWLWEQIQSEEGAAYEMLTGILAAAEDKSVALACHCAPKPCHADVIASALTWMGSNATGRRHTVVLTEVNAGRMSCIESYDFGSHAEARQFAMNEFLRRMETESIYDLKALILNEESKPIATIDVEYGFTNLIG